LILHFLIRASKTKIPSDLVPDSLIFQAILMDFSCVVKIFSTNLNQQASVFFDKILHIFPSKSWYYIIWFECLKTGSSWDFVSDFLIFQAIFVDFSCVVKIFSTNLNQQASVFFDKIPHILPSKSWYYIIWFECLKTGSSWDFVSDFLIFQAIFVDFSCVVKIFSTNLNQRASAFFDKILHLFSSKSWY
jgi:hypothetical protein